MKDSEKKTGFLGTSRMLSFASSSILLFLIIAFIGGYFLGQKQSIEHFVSTADTQTFADYMRAALYNFEEPLVRAEAAPVELSHTAYQTTTCDKDSRNTWGTNKYETHGDTQSNSIKHNNHPPKTSGFYGALIGFSSHANAQRYVDRLQKQLYPVTLCKRISTSVHGKKIPWYQVTTSIYDNKAELLALINAIQKTEKLTDVRIMSTHRKNSYDKDHTTQ